ncbi:prepilin-type N-terminal cleavage/methylation domain-containing protein [Halomonas qinghailakensis]|uniref:Prepilin-type N-terminal cleavage/methylation domain-containing protein n=2 Tax=Halomonas TaxID=2745 RepID=A0AA46TMU1_9GAMM|nr:MULTISPECIES: prepilin-type N-terminal cleavage/methylation domain-containing protein [Halomonas]UYO73034.1 prepilin-type N-terminal cleavage/methylation domain-containing protein [Halomonas sp. ZZQ-149]UYV18847.1 prepilin-type N-terminal cleavage/methylation domain-containing protein [Halomonas qaidamensis]
MDEQRGFTLPELLVAMAIGVVVVLGAGQLFLSTFHTFKQVDQLGRHQEALLYVATTVADTLRRQGATDENGAPFFRLQCVVVDAHCRCTVQDMRESQPLVTFDYTTSDDAAGVGCERDEPLGTPVGKGVSMVSLPLGRQGAAVDFYVTHRAAALQAGL